MDGILFLSGPGMRQGYSLSGASIMDIAPTVLALLGVPVPNEMDGRVLEAALSGALLDELNITFASTEGLQPELVPTAEMSAEDEEILVTRLRDLGYIA
jgi:arylsulfatase A-like enzyme